MTIDKNVFDPALLSFPDCDFLLKHAGEAPVVALRELPQECNRPTMAQWIERFYELEELKKARGYEWVGVEAIKSAIKTYLEVREEWRKDQAYGAPKHPSMFAFDSRGNAHESGPGSDSGRVRTYFDSNGKRVPFALNIVESGQVGNWKPSWIANKAAATTEPTEAPFALIYPEGENCIKCGVKGCGHTETFNTDSRASQNAARARMSRHLRTAKFEPNSHLELHTLEFRSGKVR